MSLEEKHKHVITVTDVQELDGISDKESLTGGVFGHDKARLKKGLNQRHIQMLTLVGVFGTGLFLSSGGTLNKAGPAGMLLAYILVGLVIGLNQIAIAEVACLMPATGATVRHAEHFIDEALGFSYGWISVYGALMPSEISAGAVIISYWSDLNPAIWITILGVLVVLTNSYSVRFYGEVEFVFALFKLALVFGLIVCGLVIDLGGVPGQERLGFHYWKSPYDAFREYLVTGSAGRLVGFWSAISSVVYAYTGLQHVPLFAGEVQKPRTAIWTACKRVCIRILTLYWVTVLILTMIVPANDPLIASGTGTAESSPFVIAMQRAGIKALPSIVNAVVLTSAWSAGNLGLIQASRTLFALAAKGQAPQIFLKTNKQGVPFYGLLVGASFLPLAYMSISSQAAVVFSWFQDITSANALVSWVIISLNHIHMTRAMKAQGIPRSRLPQKVRIGPSAAWISGAMSLLFLLTGGFTNFIKGHFNISSFFTSYFSIPLTIGLYFFWKLFKKTRYLRPHEVDLDSLFQDVEDNPEEPEPPLRGWRWINILWA